MNSKKLDIFCALIIAGLSFSLIFSLSAPGLFLNDEWITVNQLHQLVSGGDIVINEGKYGSFYTGEKSDYFLSRGNYLAYSLTLPLLSLPAMYLIQLSGMQFRFFFLFVWGIITVGSFLLGAWVCDQHHKRLLSRVFWVMMILFTIFFILNLYFYHPYPVGPHRPIESAAVIFTNEVLFALMASTIFLVFRNIRCDILSSVYATSLILACSTYFFWASTAKDHVLVACILTGIVFCFSLLIEKQSGMRWAGLFVVSGILCWVRPEYGIILCLGMLIGLIILIFVHMITKRSEPRFSITPRFFFWSIAGLLVGLIPFFINNFIITGNPVTPPQLLYFIGEGSPLSDGGIMEISGTVVRSDSYLHMIHAFFLPTNGFLISDLYSLFISPKNGAVGILLICPLIILAFLYFITDKRLKFSSYTRPAQIMILFLLYLIILTFGAYFRTITGSIASAGSLPDMRYFSPFYLLLGSLSFLIFEPVINRVAQKGIIAIICSLICVPVILTFIIMRFPIGGDFFMYTSVIQQISVFMILMSIACICTLNHVGKLETSLPYIIACLIIPPAVFQFMMVVLFSFAKVNGYYFWIPFFEYVFTKVIILIH